MQSSSNTRSKGSFVPWLAALILGATAHAGWLIHELRGDAHGSPKTVEVIVEVDARTRPRATATPRCRHTGAEARALARERAQDRVGSELGLGLDLDLWAHKTARYTYTIDRRALAHVALAEVELDLDLSHLGVVARVLGVDDPIELRNIHGGTPLWWLGLRNGDRVLAISTRGEHELERVEVALERRGRPVALIYDII